jgi:hypothetical protein
VALAILLAVVAGVVIALVALLGGGRRTVASRSAAAFEEAQRKGLPVAGAEHGGHGAVSPGGGPGDHTAAEKPAAAAGHAGMEMPPHGKTAMPGHAGMEMPARGKAAMPGHAGMEMSAEGKTAMPGHAGMQMPSGSPPEPPPKAAVAGPGQPAATLEPDPLDAPAATSQRDAKRSAEMAAQMGSGGMTHDMGSYSQLDAGRESVEKAQPAMPDYQGMGHGSMPPSTPTLTPDTKKPRPAPTPVPTPSGHVHPGGGQR